MFSYDKTPQYRLPPNFPLVVGVKPEFHLTFIRGGYSCKYIGYTPIYISPKIDVTVKIIVCDLFPSYFAVVSILGKFSLMYCVLNPIPPALSKGPRIIQEIFGNKPRFSNKCICFYGFIIFFIELCQCKCGTEV